MTDFQFQGESASPLQLSPVEKRRLRDLEDLWRWADDALKRGTARSDELRHAILFMLTGAIHRRIRGLIAEVRGGAVDGIDGSMRTMIEALINANYILGDPTNERAEAFLWDDVRSRRATAVRMIQIRMQDPGRPGTPGSLGWWREKHAKLDKRLKDAEKQFGRSRTFWPPLEQRALQAGSRRLYAEGYGLFSQDEHLAAGGLKRFVNHEQAPLVTVSLAHDAERLSSILGTAYVYYAGFLRSLANELGILPTEELDRFDPIVVRIRAEDAVAE